MLKKKTIITLAVIKDFEASNPKPYKLIYAFIEGEKSKDGEERYKTKTAAEKHIQLFHKEIEKYNQRVKRVAIKKDQVDKALLTLNMSFIVKYEILLNLKDNETKEYLIIEIFKEFEVLIRENRLKISNTEKPDNLILVLAVQYKKSK
ncbi:3889_t:CDS:1 [Racocetra persica]|uniref:3889_t:CDS:1 n=1 Tax=Racocetra persica TaxID=160502 RepID=A0ACA9MKV2_9GLOM|nr:3889_t:CDS:1 [Racocetra persica]